MEHKPYKKPLPVAPENFTFQGLDIEIHGIKNFSAKEQDKFKLAILIGKLVLNSKEFKEAIINNDFTETHGLTSIQIWELMCTGKDIYNTEDDNDIDVFITMYHNFWTGTVGYTYPSTFKTWINRKFFSSFKTWEVFGNVVHESLHNFGFDHITTRYESVPYKIGYIARDLLKQVEVEGKVLTPLNIQG